jgi:hypothetical protein
VTARGETSPGPSPRARQLRLAAVLLGAVAIGFIAWLVFIKDDDDDGGGSATPVAATVDDLRALSGTAGHPVYWIGRRPTNTYELTQTSDGSIYVRYLPPGVELGDRRPNFTTIGTYPHPNSMNTVEQAARREGAVSRSIRGGGLSVSNTSRPRSVYLAYPSEPDLLLEVYDPSPSRARRLASSGRVKPVR